MAAAGTQLPGPRQARTSTVPLLLRTMPLSTGQCSRGAAAAPAPAARRRAIASHSHGTQY